MKKKLLFVGVAFMTLSAIQAQEGVGIGKSVLPDATAVLDVGSDTKGILIPRVNLLKEDDKTTIKGGDYPESLLVYHKKGTGSVLTSGYYFWNGTLWKALMSKSSTELSETLTSLSVKIENKETVLSYKDEKGLSTDIEISKELKNSENFKTWINSLVSAKAAGVSFVDGPGIKVVGTDIGTPEAPLMEYTISALPNGITLAGDVTGKADNTSVDKIKGIEVVTPGDTNFGEALIYGADKKWKTGKPIVEIKDITNKADLTGVGAIKVTSGGTGALLAATTLEIDTKGIKSTMIDDAAVTTDKIVDGAVTLGKLAEGTGVDLVLTTDANKKPTWVAKTDIATKATLTTGGGIVVGDGTSSVTTADNSILKATTISLKDGGVSEVKLASNAVTTTKVADGAITLGKLAEGTGVDLVLTTDANKKPTWVAKTDIATKATLTTGGGIVVGDGTSSVTTADNSILKATTISLKDGGVSDVKLATDAVTTVKIKDLNITNAKIAASTLTVDKLATDLANKNKHLTTDKTGKPQWESKHIVVTTATPIATNEVVDGFKVYTLKIADGTVVEPNATGTALGYNSAIKAIPVANLSYLLTAQVYDKDNKLLVSGVTDVTNNVGVSVSFRFGVNNMYSVLPVKADYKVLLKYVSNEAAD
ncbi:hypothetical protein LNQ81_00170 [Myroides sp. M-43]|uniref:hypothetical protein n=1 Tax=Myroides oncorhynchi TaxID=2893756 RepID=UPI001E4312DD|nr:hypothetical protein [Myroides oncorhynchi]MCC9041154.1 hypothetical protein [Myroides oncorhynchi]